MRRLLHRLLPKPRRVDYAVYRSPETFHDQLEDRWKRLGMGEDEFPKSGFTRDYFTTFARFIDDVVKPNGTVFPTDKGGWERYARFMENEFEPLNMKHGEMLASLLPCVVGRNENEKIKSLNLVYNPQMTRQMYHYMGRERVEQYYAAVAAQSITPLKPEGLSKVQKKFSKGAKDWYGLEFASASLNFPVKDKYYKERFKLLEAFIQPTDAVGNELHPTRQERLWQLDIGTVRPYGAYAGWTEQMPVIPVPRSR